MPDMSAIAGLVSSLQAATEISKAMIGLRDGAMIQSKVIELQGVILAAQSSALAAQSDQFTVLERVRELEKEMANLEAWNREKERYELTTVGSGALAYKLKPEAQGAEPEHYLCATCYQAHRKSILQPETLSHGRVEMLVCHTCGAEIILHGSREDPAKRAKPSRPGPRTWGR
jgi:hypothetical protein